MAIIFTFLSASTLFGQESQSIHVVQQGETFASIAAKYSISESELKRTNPNARTCFVGMKLTIKTTNNPKPSIKINKTWSEMNNNVYLKALQIHVNLDIYNMAGKNASVYACFYDSNQKGIFSSFSSSGLATIHKSKIASCKSSQAHWDDFVLSIPYNGFLPKGTGIQKYYYKIYVAEGGKWIDGSSDLIPFTIDWGKKTANAFEQEKEGSIINDGGG